MTMAIEHAANRISWRAAGAIVEAGADQLQ
jgi:hypothetical protein